MTSPCGSSPGPENRGICCSRVSIASRTNVYSLIADNSTHPLDKTTYGENDDSKSIGKTVESETEYLNVVLTIWLEGWQPLQKSSTDTSKVASWDIAKYLGSSFDVGFEFTAE